MAAQPVGDEVTADATTTRVLVNHMRTYLGC
jgi:hypothetical protein